MSYALLQLSKPLQDSSLILATAALATASTIQTGEVTRLPVSA